MAMVVLAVAGASLVAGWLFVLWHHRFHLTASAVVLMLGWAAVLSVVYFLWRTADNADLDDHEDWWKPAGKLDELEREKRSLLKAIKETELDRDTGKLSDKDAGEVIARYRARAIGVIKAIEEAGAASGPEVSEEEALRQRIEREVRARVTVDKSAKKKTKKAKAKEATS
jgi:hypothetical protein